MKCQAQYLAQHLATKALKKLYLILSTDGFLAEQIEIEIINSAKKLGFTETERVYFDKKQNTQDIEQTLLAGSLFAHKKIIILNFIESPSVQLQKVIQKYVRSNDTSKLIISKQIKPIKLKSKWVQELEKIGCLIPIWPIELENLGSWLQQQAKKLNITLSKEAISILINRTYGNLLAAKQIIDKLSINNLGKLIEAQQVEDIAGQHARFDIFALNSAMLTGDLKKCLEVLQYLKDSKVEANLIAWHICKELRLVAKLHIDKKTMPLAECYKKQGIWLRRQADYNIALRKISYTDCLKLLQQAAILDQMIKGLTPANNYEELEKLIWTLNNLQNLHLTA